MLSLPQASATMVLRRMWRWGAQCALLVALLASLGCVNPAETARVVCMRCDDAIRRCEASEARLTDLWTRQVATEKRIAGRRVAIQRLDAETQRLGERQAEYEDESRATGEKLRALCREPRYEPLPIRVSTQRLFYRAHDHFENRNYRAAAFMFFEYYRREGDNRDGLLSRARELDSLLRAGERAEAAFVLKELMKSEYVKSTDLGKYVQKLSAKIPREYMKRVGILDKQHAKDRARVRWNRRLLRSSEGRLRAERERLERLEVRLRQNVRDQEAERTRRREAMGELASISRDASRLIPELAERSRKDPESQAALADLQLRLSSAAAVLRGGRFRPGEQRAPLWVRNIGRWQQERGLGGRVGRQDGQTAWVIGTSRPMRGTRDDRALRRSASGDALFHLMRMLGIEVSYRAESSSTVKSGRDDSLVEDMVRRSMTSEAFDGSLSLREEASYTCFLQDGDREGSGTWTSMILYEVDLHALDGRRVARQLAKSLDEELTTKGGRLSREERDSLTRLIKSLKARGR